MNRITLIFLSSAQPDRVGDGVDLKTGAGELLVALQIGGMDRGFRLRLYHLFRALDDAGLDPGMTSGFRDDYRQSIASGNKAATNRSYHGGSLRGGYGHGLAADVVSVKGQTTAELKGSATTTISGGLVRIN